jgi:hypothetical protein
VRPTELKDLVTAILTIVAISIAARRYVEVRSFAWHEAAKGV